MNPFVGPSYHLNARKADVQGATNMLPVVHEVAGGKSIAYLDSTPGLSVFSQATGDTGFLLLATGGYLRLASGGRIELSGS